MKSLKSKIAASALALSLAGGVFVTNPTTAEAAGKPLNIKKVLNLPAEGVTTPAETFTFKFTAHSKNGDKTKANEVPTVNDVTVAYTANDKDDNDTTKDGKQLIKETANALDGVTFSEAGQYTYTVKETDGGTPDMTYSQAEYTVSLFVKKVGDNFEVTDIQIKKTKDDKSGDVTEEKTGYEPGDQNDSTKDKNKFAFENNYDKKAGNGKTDEGGTDITENDKKGFALRKTITDQNPDTNAEFKFKLKVTKPTGTHSDDKTFKYFIAGESGKIGEGNTQNYGEDFEITLKHNQRIVFSEVLLGSTVEYDETHAGAYTGSVKSATFNGTTGTEKAGVIGDQTGGNFVEYINKTQTPTGLLVDNLPFIALVAVAGAGIAFFIKGKKEDEEALA